MRRGLILLVLMVTAGMVAAACGGGGGESTKPPATKPSAGSPEEHGRQLANAQGCLGCHSATGETLVGPTWKGIYGREIRLATGAIVTADDAYITESILSPDAKVVQGFPAGTMPSFQGGLSTSDIQDIIAYIKTLR